MYGRAPCLTQYYFSKFKTENNNSGSLVVIKLNPSFSSHSISSFLLMVQALSAILFSLASFIHSVFSISSLL